MTYPTDDLTKVHLDAAADNPTQARAELEALVDKVKAMLAATGTGASNVPKLDASGLLPVAMTNIGKGALVYNSAVQTIPDNVITELTWNQEAYDDMSFHSTVTNTGKLTIPSSGVSAVRLSGMISLNNDSDYAALGVSSVYFTQNGAAGFAGNGKFYQTSLNNASQAIMIYSAPIQVTSGTNYGMSVLFNTSDSSSIDLASYSYATWFAIEVLR